jgi:hypothetical protein
MPPAPVAPVAPTPEVKPIPAPVPGNPGPPPVQPVVPGMPEVNPALQPLQPIQEQKPPAPPVPAVPEPNPPPVLKPLQPVILEGKPLTPITPEARPPVEGNPPAAPMPPVGAAPGAVTPVVSVPLPAAPLRPLPPQTPQVNSYDEVVYFWKVGDTYGSVSAARYGTDKQAAALQEWNRMHPNATDNVRQGGLPNPGEKIYLPPVHKLEGREGAFVATPLVPGPGPGGPSPAPQNYRVVANENLLEVARRVFGNSDRWGDIRQLNPQVRADQPIPIGTILHLPADARVPAENR